MFDDDSLKTTGNDKEQILCLPMRAAPFAPQTRVGVYNLVDDIYQFYGYGTYEGDCLFGEEDSLAIYQSIDDKLEALYMYGRLTSPRIRMDDGTVVWGLYVNLKTAVDMEKVFTDPNVKIQEVTPEAFMAKINSYRKDDEDLRLLLSKTEMTASLFGTDYSMGEA